MKVISAVVLIVICQVIGTSGLLQNWDNSMLVRPAWTIGSSKDILYMCSIQCDHCHDHDEAVSQR